DKDNKVINIVDRKDVNFLSNALKDKEYIGISLFNKSNKKKLSVSLLGSDKGNSSKLNVLDNYSYESGDYLRLKIKNDESINLTGDITGLRDSYLRLEDLKFNLTEQGISVEDTNQSIPFTIEFKGDNKIPKGSIFNPLEGVNATNEYDEDYTDKIQVVGNVDTNTSGSYMLTYNVIYDGKKGNPVERIITVENVLTKEELEKLKNLKGIYPPLNLQNHRNFFRSIDRKINNFIIKFKDEGNDDIYKRRQKRG
ncbi:MAG: immunoglobulin-like domain-containing protein, partial [Sarcina sp.]